MRTRGRGAAWAGFAASFARMGSLRGLAAALAMACVLACALSGAQAQAVASPSEMALARQEFVDGVEAARAGTWQSALVHFERSYALYAHPETLFNIAGAQRQLGELVAAAESYRRYLRTPDPRGRVEAERALAEIEPSLGAVALHLSGVNADDRVLLDGQPVNRAVLSAELPVDPGSHVLTVERASHEVVRESFEIDRSQRLQVRAIIPEARVVPTPAETARRAPVSERPPYTQADTSRRGLRIALWTGAVVVVAGAVVGAILFARRNDPKETQGTLGPPVNVN